MKDVLASYNRLSYLALSKEMLRLCEGIALESLKALLKALLPIVLMLVTLTCPVDWSKGV